MGPLDGYLILELASIGPAPFCAMMLADMGADVIRVDRASGAGEESWNQPALDVLNRGRRSISINLKHSEGVATLLQMVERADGMIEGYRPGVAERLGVGPDVCRDRNPKLVYGRMTGWGQTGPLATTAGHDINYIALAGALYPIGRADGPPPPPLNLVGDFGGGGMMLAFGMVCALLEMKGSGRGQVVDAAMLDGAALLTTMIYGWQAMEEWNQERGANLLDGGAPFYDTYETSDGRFVAVGSLESRFYSELLDRLGLVESDLPAQMDRASWPQMKQFFADTFRTKTRQEWCDLLEGTDVCFAPVLTLAEAPLHSHNVERGVFTTVAGLVQPAPAPRFDRSRVRAERPPPLPGQHTREILADFGYSESERATLLAVGAVREAVI